MFDDIIKLALPGVEEKVKKELVARLKAVAAEFISQNVVTTVSHTILKGIDTVIATSVHALTSDQIEKLAGAYTDKIDQQFVQLNQAIGVYIPLQVAVEVAKKEHGDKSGEANAARALRAKGIDEVKSEFGDLFGVILGGHVQD
jgi:hypothetical protein